MLVCGHTHILYHRILPSGRHVVNAGSVGKPKDHNPEACYVVLETNNRDLTVTFKRVPYDVERAAQAIEASEMPTNMRGCSELELDNLRNRRRPIIANRVLISLLRNYLKR